MKNQHMSEIIALLDQLSKKNQSRSEDTFSLIEKVMQSKLNNDQKECAFSPKNTEHVSHPSFLSNDIGINQDLTPCQQSIASAIRTLGSAFGQCSTTEELTDCEILLRATRIALQNGFCSQALCILEVAADVCLTPKTACNSNVLIDTSGAGTIITPNGSLYTIDITVSSEGVCPNCNPGTIQINGNNNDGSVAISIEGNISSSILRNNTLDISISGGTGSWKINGSTNTIVAAFGSIVGSLFSVSVNTARTTISFFDTRNPFLPNTLSSNTSGSIRPLTPCP